MKRLQILFIFAAAALLMASHDPTAYVPSSRTVAGKALSSNVTIACADLSNAASSCATDATNASNLASGTLPNARLSAVPNTALANSSITIAGHAVSLGGSQTLTTSDVGILTGTSSAQNPGALLAGGCNNFTITVTGATTAQTVKVSAIGGVDLGALITVTASITSANTVTVHECAILAATPVSAQFRAVVE
jgi:hypothetical protein